MSLKRKLLVRAVACAGRGSVVPGSHPAGAHADRYCGKIQNRRTGNRDDRGGGRRCPDPADAVCHFQLSGLSIRSRGSWRPTAIPALSGARWKSWRAAVTCRWPYSLSFSAWSFRCSNLALQLAAVFIATRELRAPLLRLNAALSKWSMSDVFVMGVLVAYMAGSASGQMGDMLTMYAQLGAGFLLLSGLLPVRIAAGALLTEPQPALPRG